MMATSDLSGNVVPDRSPCQDMAGARLQSDGEAVCALLSGNVPRQEEDRVAALPRWASHFIERVQQADRRVQRTLHPRKAVEVSSYTGAIDGLLDVLNLLLHRERSEGACLTAASPQPAVQRHPLSRRALLSLLSQLQATAPVSLRVEAITLNESLSQRLRREVMTAVAQIGLDPTSVCIAADDGRAMDLAGCLFDVVMGWPGLEGRGRELMARLVVPYAKAAVLDRRLFMQVDHPARRLLDLLGDACEHNSCESPAERMLISKAELIVDRLVAEFNEDLTIFATLALEFSAHLELHRRRIEIAERRAIETQHGQEKWDLARCRAAAELQWRVDKVLLPQTYDTFLRKLWQHHLIISILRGGGSASRSGICTEQAQALALADGMLCELAQARERAVTKPWLASWLPALHEVLASAGIYAAAAQAAIVALQNTLQAIFDTGTEPESLPLDVPELEMAPAMVADNLFQVPEASTLDTRPTAADMEHVSRLPLGAWLDFIDDDGAIQAGKLSWISQNSARRLFVNRHGARLCVALPEQLALMSRMGRLRLRSNEAAFDRAMRGVVDGLLSLRPDAEEFVTVPG